MNYPNTPNYFTSRITQGNPANACPYGMAQLDGGMCQISQINGYGLLTLGFIWQAPEIWFHPQAMDGIGPNGASMTVWTAAAGYSGCVSASLVVTTWVSSQSFGSEVTI